MAASLNVFDAPWLQRKCDDKRWEREKLYDLHSEVYEALQSHCPDITQNCRTACGVLPWKNY